MLKLAIADLRFTNKHIEILRDTSNATEINNFNEMKTRILSLVLIAVFSITTTAMAQNEQKRERSPEQRELMMKRRMAMKQHQNFFTPEQREKMKELRLETAKQVKPLKNELNELKARQRTLSTADNADLKAINKNIDKMSEIKAKMAKIMAAQHQQVRSMLSEEQLLKFDAMQTRNRTKPAGFERDRQKRRTHEQHMRR